MALLLSVRFSENGESIALNILLQGNPEILDAVKYFDDMKQPLVSTLLIASMNHLHFNMEKFAMSCSIWYGARHLLILTMSL
jgi:hypothetical protein